VNRETKKKVKQLPQIAKHIAVSSIESFLIEFPEHEDLLLTKDKSHQYWDLYMTVAAIVAAFHCSDLDKRKDVKKFKYLMKRELNEESYQTLIELLSCVHGILNGNINRDPYHAIGCWVILKLKSKESRKDERIITLSIIHLLKDCWIGYWTTGSLKDSLPKDPLLDTGFMGV